MTSETRTMVDISDIIGVEIECQECMAKIAYPREKNQERIAQRCPNCNVDLFILTIERGGQGSVSMEQVRSLMRIIRFLATPGADLKANVRLNVKAE
jgi:hypothetical protein